MGELAMIYTVADAEQIFVIDASLENAYFVHQDVHVTTHDHPLDIKSLLQACMEFVFHHEKSSMNVLHIQDAFDLWACQIILENWETKDRLYCTIHDIKDCSLYLKHQAAEKITNVKLTPEPLVIQKFTEVLGDHDLEEDTSVLESVLIQTNQGSCVHKLEQRQSATALFQRVIEIVPKTASVHFKIITYPVLEIHYEDQRVTQIWFNHNPNIEQTLKTHEFKGL